MRKAMGEQAVALSRAVGYHSAGTVELIVSGADTTGESFYFLEMNTRLQVEHPVTEQVTGLDLVEQMIRVAAGEQLAFGQDDIQLKGWSVENRVYAEDPYRGFLPSTGRLVRYQPPKATLHQSPFVPSEVEGRVSTSLDTNGRGIVRVDDGVFEGGEVSMFYDPMIAKLVTYADTREEAIDLQIDALDSFVVEGIGHNVDFLSALMQHPRFRSGEITTGFIAEEYPEGFQGAPADPQLIRDLAVIAALVAMETEFRACSISGQLGGHIPPAQDRVVRIAGEEHSVQFDGYEGGLLANVDGGDAPPLDLVGRWQPGQPVFRGTIDGRSRTVQIARRGRQWRLTTRGASHIVDVLPAHVAELSRFMIEKVPPDLSKYLLCPMPGLLTALNVGEGDKVEAGQPLAVVEAMKMENILRAEKSGTVAKVAAKPGESLAVDAVILEFE
jgi:propionyl-CoA carboxylase alpha chain